MVLTGAGAGRVRSSGGQYEAFDLVFRRSKRSEQHDHENDLRFQETVYKCWGVGTETAG